MKEEARQKRNSFRLSCCWRRQKKTVAVTLAKYVTGFVHPPSQHQFPILTTERKKEENFFQFFDESYFFIHPKICILFKGEKFSLWKAASEQMDSFQRRRCGKFSASSKFIIGFLSMPKEKQLADRALCVSDLWPKSRFRGGTHSVCYDKKKLFLLH